jgi:hypothetical protein
MLSRKPNRRPGNADSPDDVPQMVSDRRHNAPEADLKFLVVDGTATLSCRVQFNHQLRRLSDRVLGLGSELTILDDCLSLIPGTCGKNSLAERGAIHWYPPAYRRHSAKLQEPWAQPVIVNKSVPST